MNKEPEPTLSEGRDSTEPAVVVQQCPWWRRWLQRSVLVGAFCLLAANVVCALSSQIMIADLVSNFRWQLRGGGLGLSFAAWRLGRTTWWIFLLLLTLPHAWQVLPYYWPLHWLNSRLEVRSPLLEGTPAQTPSIEVIGGPQCLRVVTLNLYFRNRDGASVLSFLRAAAPDLIVVNECTGEWWETLSDGLGGTHPYQSSGALSRWTGTRIFSRWPLTVGSEVPEYASIHGSDSMITVQFDWRGQSVLLTGVHPSSPVSRERFEDRNQRLETIGVVSREVQGPAIVAGDFNCSSGSPYFRNMLEHCGWQDTRCGFGWQASWPAWAPPGLRVPIDHVLVNHYWRVVHREVGPNVGSDHLPVIVDLELRQPRDSRDSGP